jgi:adenine-specific DNA-methyltransferase
MFLDYDNKKTEQEILALRSNGRLSLPLADIKEKNLLMFGDNFEIMQCLLWDLNFAGKIDMVYIDPPFATNNIFRVGQERTNTISSSYSDTEAYCDLLKGAEFLEFLRERIILIRELMSEKASIYLHIDYKIGHYVKVIMDEIFGEGNFRGDITRIKCNPKNFSRKGYGNIKDLILFYSKTDDFIWNEPKESMTESDVERLFKKIDENGKRYTTIPLHAPGETVNGATGQSWRGVNPPPGRHWRSSPQILEQLDKDGLVEWSSNGVPRKKIYADECEAKGKKVQDIWEYKDPQYPAYPTEKNIDMIEFLVKASSNPNDTIMDCFMGSGTTLVAANRLGRNWIGIDSSEEALKIAENRLKKEESGLFVGKPEYQKLKLEMLMPSITAK